MALTGKIVAEVEIKCGGDLLHELLRHKPNDITTICPDKIRGCDLVSGDRGAVGSVVTWHYTHDGKHKIIREIIEEVDEKNHKIVFNMIEGDIKELYKVFVITFHVEPKGDKQLATWTIDFEKTNASVPYPTAEIDLLCFIIKDMDDHHLKKL